jgi:hypothetical protein
MTSYILYAENVRIFAENIDDRNQLKKRLIANECFWDSNEDWYDIFEVLHKNKTISYIFAEKIVALINAKDYINALWYLYDFVDLSIIKHFNSNNFVKSVNGSQSPHEILQNCLGTKTEPKNIFCSLVNKIFNECHANEEFKIFIKNNIDNVIYLFSDKIWDGSVQPTFVPFFQECIQERIKNYQSDAIKCSYLNKFSPYLVRDNLKEIILRQHDMRENHDKRTKDIYGDLGLPSKIHDKWLDVLFSGFYKSKDFKTLEDDCIVNPNFRFTISSLQRLAMLPGMQALSYQHVDQKRIDILQASFLLSLDSKKTKDHRGALRNLVKTLLKNGAKIDYSCTLGVSFQDACTRAKEKGLLEKDLEDQLFDRKSENCNLQDTKTLKMKGPAISIDPVFTDENFNLKNTNAFGVSEVKERALGKASQTQLSGDKNKQGLVNFLGILWRCYYWNQHHVLKRSVIPLVKNGDFDLNNIPDITASVSANNDNLKKSNKQESILKWSLLKKGLLLIGFSGVVYLCKDSLKSIFSFLLKSCYAKSV